MLLHPRSRRIITRYGLTWYLAGFHHADTLRNVQLAKKYHPDSSKEKGAKEKFVEIQEAYDVSAPLDRT